MPNTVITIIGNVAAEPTLRFVGDAAIANFSIGSTPSTFNKQKNEWENGETLWIKVNAWRELGEGAAEQLKKGSKVVVIGRLKQTSWTDKDSGAKRTGYELDADDIGLSVRVKRETASAGVSSGGGWGSQTSLDDSPPF